MLPVCRREVASKIRSNTEADHPYEADTDGELELVACDYLSMH